MKKFKKTTAVGLSLFMISTMTSSVLAVETPSHKEEVVYIMTKANGDVKNVNVVNIFDGGDILDYGDYSSVKMLTTNSQIKKLNDKITFSSDDKKVYYQGTMKNKTIPWNISIRYFIDGKEYTSQQVAGKSGALEIKFQITENKDDKANEYYQYALQAQLTLDTERFENIKATGATLANVGSNKQISYTILPGKGLDTSIYADVENFEMDSISINGVRLNLDIDIDSSELTEKVEELMDAMNSLNDGAVSLSHGSQDLQTGSQTLNNGISNLNSGMSGWNVGVLQLQTGMTTLEKGIDELNTKSSSLTNGSTQIKNALITIQSELNSFDVNTTQVTELTNASHQIEEALVQYNEGIKSLNNYVGYLQYKEQVKKEGLDIDGLQKQNTDMITVLEDQIQQLRQSMDAMNEGEEKNEIKAQINQLENIVQLLNANNGAVKATESYLNGVSRQISTLNTKMNDLVLQYDMFDQSLQSMADTLDEMLVKMSMLIDAIQTLTKEYEHFDQGINDYTTGVAQVVAGYKQMTKGVSSLTLGSQDLLKGTNSLLEGSKELYNGVVSLNEGADQLSCGTQMMKDETTNMSEDIEAQIDDILSKIQSEDTTVQSFVSDKNTHVDSVQFVIKTDEIKKQTKTKIKSVHKKEQSIWEKFLALFEKN